VGEHLLQPRRVTAMAPMQQPVRPYIRRYLGHRSNPALATSAARQSRTIHQWGRGDAIFKNENQSSSGRDLSRSVAKGLPARVCVANISTAVRITTHAHTSRAERNVRPSDDVDDSIAHQRRIRNCHGEIARPNGLTLSSVAEALQARTKETLPGRREANCNRRCRGGSRPVLLRAPVRF